MYICMQYLSSKNIWYINVLYVLPTSLSNPAAHMFYWLTTVCLSDVLFAFLTGAVYLCILHQMKSLLLLYGHQQIPINIVINMSGNGQLPIIKGKNHVKDTYVFWTSAWTQIMSRKQLNPKNRDCHREAHCCYMMAKKSVSHWDNIQNSRTWPLVR